MKLEEERIQVPWGIIALQCWGDRNLTPVILVHGTQDNSASFERLVQHLSQDYYYICIDLPGHGYSSPFPPGLPLEFMDFVSVLQRIVHVFELDKYILLGHSIGGAIATFFAASFPKKVLKLILIEPASLPLMKELFLIKYINGTNDVLKLEQQKEPIFSSYEEAIKKLKQQRPIPMTEVALEPILKRSIKQVNNGYQSLLDPRTRYDLRPTADEEMYTFVYKQIKCPILVILGENSEFSWFYTTPGFFLNVLEVLGSSHKLSQIVKIEGNHCVHNNKPGNVAPFINSFINKSESKL